MNDLISIIVPIYNVEKYLNDCIESIVNQSYSNLEIILVDDGSPDNCPQICDEWAEKDNRIKVIHKPNGGLSDARNTGLDIASGEYIAFIDSDDYIDVDYVYAMYSYLKCNNLKLIQCGVKLVTDKKEFIKMISYDETCILDYMSHNLAMYDEHPSDNVISCNKLYHKSLFDDLRFPVGILNEDEATIYKCVFKAKQIGVVKECLYNYVQHSNSIVNSGFSERKTVIVDILKERELFFKENNEPELAYAAQKHYMNLLTAVYAKVYYKVENNSAILAELKNKFDIEYKQFSADSLKLRIKLRLFRHFPRLFLISMKMAKKV